MKTNGTFELGGFKGIDLLNRSESVRTLSAEDVLRHSEAEAALFLPDGSNPFVRLLLNEKPSGRRDVAEVMRIFDELRGDPKDLVKACALRKKGRLLDAITKEAVAGSRLYVCGPGRYSELVIEAAVDIGDHFLGEAYELWYEAGISTGICCEELVEEHVTIVVKTPAGLYIGIDLD